MSWTNWLRVRLLSLYFVVVMVSVFAGLNSYQKRSLGEFDNAVLKGWPFVTSVWVDTTLWCKQHHLPSTAPYPRKEELNAISTTLGWRYWPVGGWYANAGLLLVCVVLAGLYVDRRLRRHFENKRFQFSLSTGLVVTMVAGAVLGLMLQEHKTPVLGFFVNSRGWPFDFTWTWDIPSRENWLAENPGERARYLYRDVFNAVGYSYPWEREVRVLYDVEMLIAITMLAAVVSERIVHRGKVEITGNRG